MLFWFGLLNIERRRLMVVLLDEDVEKYGIK